MIAETANLPAPVLSVLMAVHNGEAFLDQAVQSILRQTQGDFEFLIVDDASTDRTPAMLRGYAERDPRIRIFPRQKIGLTKALNVVLAESRGEFIARMDADDIAMPTRFERQVAYLREHVDVVACGTGFTKIDSQGGPLGAYTPALAHEAIMEKLLDGRGGELLHPALMVRHSAMRQVNGYRPEIRWPQDLDLYLRLAEVGRLANLPEPLMKYRKHGHAATLSQWHALHAESIRVLADAHRRRGIPLPANAMIWHRDGAIYDHTQVGWRSLSHRQYRTAWSHVRFLIRHALFRPGTWRLALHTAIAPLQDAVKRK